MSIEIDWGLVLNIALHIHVVSMIVLISIALSSLEFWKMLAKDKKYKKKSTWFELIILTCVPIVSQISLCIWVQEAYQSITSAFEAKREQKQSVLGEDVLPEHLQKLCEVILEKKDYEILEESYIYNKSLQLTIKRDRVNIKGHTYHTHQYEKTVKNILHTTQYSDIYEIYKQRRGV